MTTVQSPTVAIVVIDNTSTPIAGFLCPSRFRAKLKETEHITSGETSEQVHSLLPLTSHIHARGGAIGRLQTSVDENTIDFPGMLAGLQELGYIGFLALEYVWVDWRVAIAPTTSRKPCCCGEHWSRPLPK
jgi:hypothetical protein